MTSRTLAFLSAVTLAGATPALAQQSSQSPQQSSQSSGGQTQVVEQQDLQKYVKALQQMAQHEAGIQTALQQGQPVDSSVLDKVPQQAAQKAIEQSGLGPEQFRYITEQLTTNPQAKQQFQQVAQQQAQQSGGSQSGAQPSSSPK